MFGLQKQEADLKRQNCWAEAKTQDSQHDMSDDPTGHREPKAECKELCSGAAGQGIREWAESKKQEDAQIRKTRAERAR